MTDLTEARTETRAAASVNPAGPQVGDGRTARRERGRLLVIDSMIDLVFEGHLPPTAEQVAERADVSMSSLFRYFETFDELRNQAASRFFDRYAHRYEIQSLGEGSLEQRIDALVSSRLDLHESNHPMSRLIRHRAHQVSVTRERLDWLRAELAGQVREHFRDELAKATPALADDIVGVVGTLTSFEAWDLLRNHHGRSPTQIRRAWKRALAAVLAV